MKPTVCPFTGLDRIKFCQKCVCVCEGVCGCVYVGGGACMRLSVTLLCEDTIPKGVQYDKNSIKMLFRANCFLPL